MMELVFMLVAIGTPLAICIVAVIGAHFHENDNATLLDCQPTRSPETEARLRHRELDEMLDAVNRCRRQRGAPERTLQELSSPQPVRPSRGSRHRRAVSRP